MLITILISHNYLSCLGNDLVLGPTQPVTLERTSSSDVPIEQAITRQRMRPGSGNLSIRVSTDGPTRVLQVVDINKTGVTKESLKKIIAICIVFISRDPMLNGMIVNGH